MLRLLSLCSGIAGFELGLIAANLHHAIAPVQFVERDSYCQNILTKWFPNIPIHSDLETFHASPGQFEIICGGIPCQGHSLAGKRKGAKDERNLWPEYFRLIKETKPIGFILENVGGIRSSDNGRFFKRLLTDIAQAGYDAEWGSLSVKSLGGTHERERFFLIAYPQGSRCQPIKSAIAQQERSDQTPSTLPDCECTSWTQNLSSLCGDDARLSSWMASRLLKIEDLDSVSKTAPATRKEIEAPLRALGNSICPAVAAIAWKKLYERITTIR